VEQELVWETGATLLKSPEYNLTSYM